ncbi:MAG: SusF/SusE family outer membrane protein [Paludibacter sp.]
MRQIKLISSFQLVFLLITSFFTSCEQNLPDDLVKAGALAVSATKSELVLNQKNSLTTTALNFSWTTGTNSGTGASISYTLQLDIKGNNFSKALSLNLGKGIYSRSFTVEELNDSLLSHWNCTPGTTAELEVRVVSTIYSSPQYNEISAVISLKATPYQPVSKTLYLYGTASPKANDLNSPLGFKEQADPTVFVYQGMLNAGTLKFITTKGQEIPSYNMGSDTTKIIYRTDAGQANNLFTIKSSGVYRLEISLLDLTASVTKINYPAYGEVYLAGTATPNGTDFSKATKLAQSATNPFIFTYQGVLKAGNFKFPVNTNSDGNQDMFMRTDDTHFYTHQGGTAGDDQWTIAKKGFYTLTLNQQDNTITIYREKLFMVGDATSIGWTITNAIQMTEDALDGCIFSYTGPMLAGGFKFPVNRNSDWGQDMYMRTDDTHMYRHIGGQADDKKWTITTAGNYVITANIETLTLSSVKQ